MTPGEALKTCTNCSFIREETQSFDRCTFVAQMYSFDQLNLYNAFVIGHAI